MSEGLQMVNKFRRYRILRVRTLYSPIPVGRHAELVRPCLAIRAYGPRCVLFVGFEQMTARCLGRRLGH
jgi:hypothetical protein